MVLAAAGCSLQPEFWFEFEGGRRVGGRSLMRVGLRDDLWRFVVHINDVKRVLGWPLTGHFRGLITGRMFVVRRLDFVRGREDLLLAVGSWERGAGLGKRSTAGAGG